MRHFHAKFLLTAAAVSFGLVGAVHAADLSFPVKATPMPSCAWCGWYAGANGGYGWGDATGRVGSFSTAPNDANLGPPLAAGVVPSFFGTKPEGGFGGGQFGYNWVTGNWLLGLEADIQGADVGHSTAIAFPGDIAFGSALSTGREHVDWFGTVRGRLGVTLGNVLLYGTGGLAYGGVNSAVTERDTSPGGSLDLTGNSRESRFGWAGGVGAEWMFAPKWSVKAEYLHVDLGTSNTTITDSVNAPGAFATYRFHHEFDSARVGVNYHFSGPVVAKY